MSPQIQLCPRCGAAGKDGHIAIHSRKQGRYRCKQCQRTFTATYGSAYFQLKKPAVFTIVVTLLAYGCPPQAVVAAYGLSENTVRDWLRRSGQHAQAVHEATVGQQRWDLQHIQADEIKIQTQSGEMWMALVMMVRTRLWLGGSVDIQRSKRLIVTCLKQAAQCALCRPLLLAVDGLNMYVKAVKQAFRSQHPIGRGGRLKWVAWGLITITQVVKKRHGRRGRIERIVAQGDEQAAHHLRQSTGGGRQINSAYIERLNATFRQRYAGLTRRSRAQVRHVSTLRQAMYLLGCVYNFCTDHDSLAEALYLSPLRRHWVRRTPAMAAGLTDHRWTVEELLQYKMEARPA